MARAAVLGRLSSGRRTWRAATVGDVRAASATARTLTLDVPGWPGHLPGQHVDLRLTADDGYTATRAYSLAAPADGDRIEVTVEQVPDGEVSPYLTLVAAPGDRLEVRGPVGGWFVWHPEQPGPVQLIGGGSGVVPLMAMIRSRVPDAVPASPMRLLYSVRDPSALLYGDDLATAAAGGVQVDLVYTRSAPAGWARPPARIDRALLDEVTVPPAQQPTCYVCGPTPFVETVTDLLVQLGHDPSRIRTERFGPSGGRR